MFPISVMELDLFSAGHCQAVFGILCLLWAHVSMLGGSGPVMVSQGRDGYHCLLWAFDLCIMQQPVMGVCINLLWVCDLGNVQQSVMGFLISALYDSLSWACATACQELLIFAMWNSLLWVGFSLCTVVLSGSLANFLFMVVVILLQLSILLCRSSLSHLSFRLAVLWIWN